ncbi:MAG: L,D-transpeptidase, partial [Bacteroidaceae bacterium]|nr:L,D-transpeptidase [Bacteroidaceae bacterium]
TTVIENNQQQLTDQSTTVTDFKPASQPVSTVKSKAFLVISKLHQTLSVWDVQEGDTLLLAQYPVCLGRELGNKEKVGDMRTPESPAGQPFHISQIQDAHNWKHDFGDGRGPILAYGHWFMRLNTPGHKGIGIHGSTNNEQTVPGRASEGCVRLLDADIIDLKNRFAYVGMPVIIQAEGED